MKLIDCPYIGARPQSEFVYGHEVRRMPKPSEVIKSGLIMCSAITVLRALKKNGGTMCHLVRGLYLNVTH